MHSPSACFHKNFSACIASEESRSKTVVLRHYCLSDTKGRTLGNHAMLVANKAKLH
jgi:hypothetical protein